MGVVADSKRARGELRVNLGSQMHKYDKKRMEESPPIPCDACMGGLDAPWYVGSYIGDTLAYLTCAACCVETASFVDVCSTCVDDPSADRECDVCTKAFRRAAKKAVEVPAVFENAGIGATP